MVPWDAAKTRASRSQRAVFQRALASHRSQRVSCAIAIADNLDRDGSSSRSSYCKSLMPHSTYLALTLPLAASSLSAPQSPSSCSSSPLTWHSSCSESDILPVPTPLASVPEVLLVFSPLSSPGTMPLPVWQTGATHSSRFPSHSESRWPDQKWRARFADCETSFPWSDKGREMRNKVNNDEARAKQEV